MKLGKIFENLLGENSNIWYHGTAGLFPFKEFSPSMDGQGVVNMSRKKFGGFFFTSEPKNAEFYGENFIAKVTINNLTQAPEHQNHPPTVMKLAINDGVSYIIPDTLDGSHYSDVAVVPISNLNDVDIIQWIFVGDEEFYYESLDNFFGGDDEFVSQRTIESFIEMTGGGLDYLLDIPVFNNYYNSKESG
jgi:hypothetical protein